MSRRPAVYVIRQRADLSKVGISISPRRRLSDLTRERKTKLHLDFVGETKDGDARKIERRAHQILSERRVDGEWFATDVSAAVEAVIAAANDLGFTIAENMAYADVRAMLGIRLAPDLKAALERAAKADRRTVSNLVEKILADWLKANGFVRK